MVLISAHSQTTYIPCYYCISHSHPPLRLNTPTTNIVLPIYKQCITMCIYCDVLTKKYIMLYLSSETKKIRLKLNRVLREKVVKGIVELEQIHSSYIRIPSKILVLKIFAACFFFTSRTQSGSWKSRDFFIGSFSHSANQTSWAYMRQQ